MVSTEVSRFAAQAGAPRLRFGLALDLGSDRVPLSELVELYVPLLGDAESLGFESVWLGEQYPRRPGNFHLPSPLLVLAALAGRTRLRLGTGVTLLPAWNPLRLAYDGAVLDQLSSGRLTLGVGLGGPELTARFGTPAGPRGALMDDMLRALKALWSGAVGYSGSLVRIDGAIAPPPVQPGGPPLWVAGRAAATAARAATLGDGWYAATQYRLHEIQRMSDSYRAQLQRLGRQSARPVVSINRLVHLAPEREQAYAEGGLHVERALNAYVAMGALTGETDPKPDLLSRAQEDVCLVGSPETVVAQLERYAAAGVTHVQLRVAPAGMPFELVKRTVNLFGSRVLPRFQGSIVH